MEINMFCHFGPNTFTGAEWGSGMEAEDIFNPTALDCRQWVDVASQAGMGGIILTAKHHDGFCLWPSAYSSHTVAASPWKEGKGDVLRELRTAIDEHNSRISNNKTPNTQLSTLNTKIGMGVYISPWDRNHLTYGTTDYNSVFANTLKEVHTKYGTMFEQWFDGACGEGPNGKRQEYDWPLFEGTVTDINPACVMFSDVGPGCRWVGNEQGYAGETNWSRLSVPDGERRTDSAGCGMQKGDNWIPAEVDVSIRPGWFWHAEEHPKSVDELMEIYYNSVGRNGLLLLNVPPDKRGLIPAEDSAVLMAFRAERERVFESDLTHGARAKGSHLCGSCYRASNVLDTAYHTYWAAREDKGTLKMKLDSVTEIDMIVLQEYIPLGQRVYEVQMAYNEGDGIYPYTNHDHPLCTTIGYKRIIRLDAPIHTDYLEFTFHGMAPPIINRIALYNSKK